MSGSPTVKIAVSCHKPISCPASEVYLPVQLGAGKAAPIDGMQPDDQGENISDWNYSFSEMTAQYWAWKNLDADYIGLCHYRRYFCFDGLSHQKNDHAQIEIPCLSQMSASEYRIDDTELIVGAATAHDMVIPERWSVRGVPTPLGPQATIRDHMLAYGLMDASALDTLVEICRNRQPDYAPYVEAYLNGHVYQGYNCFIMKRALFDRMCAFEFDVLIPFHKQFDYANLTGTKKRIAGYLGEILISAFTLKLEDEGATDIVERPLTFFEDTPKPVSLGEAAHGKATQFVWNAAGVSPYAIAAGIGSLAKALPAAKACALTVVVPPKFDAAKAARLMGALTENLIVEFATWPAITGLADMREDLDVNDLECLAPLLLPWLMPDEAHAFWGEGALVFANSAWLSDDRESCAGQNVFLQRELNRPGLAGERFRSETQLGTFFLSIDLDALRCELSCADMVAFFKSAKAAVERKLAGSSVPVEPHVLWQLVQARMLGELGFAAAPFTLASQGLDIADTRQWANADTGRNWAEADDPALASFGADGMPDVQCDMQHSPLFWQNARASAAYEALVAEATNPQPHDGASLRDKLLPHNSKRRQIARALAATAKSTLRSVGGN